MVVQPVGGYLQMRTCLMSRKSEESEGVETHVVVEQSRDTSEFADVWRI